MEQVAQKVESLLLKWPISCALATPCAASNKISSAVRVESPNFRRVNVIVREGYNTGHTGNPSGENFKLSPNQCA